VKLDWLSEAFERDGYICGDDIMVPVFLALRLEKPLLVEGEPGVGKTEIAKVLARVFSTDLIRLQCYEGLDENRALYEWNYQRQLLRIQIGRRAAGEKETRGAVAAPGAGAGEAPGAVAEGDLFSEEYLLERPLLRALRAERRPVLLIDEVDKCDEEFEAFLFEVLSDFQVSIPELGTVRARQVPIVVLTSNRARELSDGLKRRCLFLFIDFPDVAKELRIIRAKVPELLPALAAQVARAVALLRAGLDLRKKPSVAETLDWARALVALDVPALAPEVVDRTASLLFKNRDDLQAFMGHMGGQALVEAAQAGDAGQAAGDAGQAGSMGQPPATAPTTAAGPAPRQKPPTGRRGK